MFEHAKVERLLVGLDAPGDGVACRNIDPPDQVRLYTHIRYVSVVFGLTLVAAWYMMWAYPAMDLQLLHANHGDLLSGNARIPICMYVVLCFVYGERTWLQRARNVDE